jgi:hypothetical protein
MPASYPIYQFPSGFIIGPYKKDVGAASRVRPIPFRYGENHWGKERRSGKVGVRGPWAYPARGISASAQSTFPEQGKPKAQYISL